MGTPIQPATSEAPLITAAEAEIVRVLGLAWNLYVDLPQEHPMSQSEFCTAIHRCQDMVLARCGQRQLASQQPRNDY